MKYGDLPGDWMNERYQIPLILVSMGKQGSRTYYKGCMVEAAPFLQENTILVLLCQQICLAYSKFGNGASQRHRETGVTYATPVLPETSYTFLYRKKLSHGASGQDGLHMIDLLL